MERGADLLGAVPGDFNLDVSVVTGRAAASLLPVGEVSGPRPQDVPDRPPNSGCFGTVQR